MTTVKTKLIYLGVLPFVFFASLAVLEVSLFDVPTTQLFIGYSVIILNFVLGTLWHNSSKWASIPLSIWTNVLSILSFILLFCPLNSSLLGLAACFIFAYFLEIKNAPLSRSSEQQAYLNVRLYITSVVTLIHLVLLVLL